MDRSRVATTKLSHHRSRTPYDRPSSATAPSTPNKGSSTAGGSSVSTPSIFARAKNFFTPRAWRRSEPIGTQTDSVETPSADTIFKHPSPTIPRPNLDRFDQLAARLGTPKTGGSSPLSGAQSPNEKLAEFFKSKGDKQLSEVETEGVLALIRQAQSQNEGLLEFSPPATGFASNPGQIVSTDAAASVQATPSAGPSEQLVQSSQSPRIRASPVSTPKYRPLYSSPGASRSSLRSSSARSSPYTPGRRRFTNVSTPYRPSPNLRKSGLQQLVWENSTQASGQNGGQTQTTEETPGAEPVSTASELVEKVEEPKKELSQTASALLSLLGPEESKDEQKTTNKAAKQDVPEEVKEFINPYASSTSRTTASASPKSPRGSKTPRTPRTPRTPKTPQSSAGAVEDSQNSSSPAIKELEKTMPRDKHRPSRPSNLRNVVAADDKLSSPSNLFKFESPKQPENKSEKEGESSIEKPQLFKPNANFSPISQLPKVNTSDKSDNKPGDKPEDKLGKPDSTEQSEKRENNTEKKTEDKDKTEPAPSLFSFAPPITSQTGFSFSPAKPLSTVVNGTEPKPQEPTFKFDSAKESTSTSTSTFKFGVPAEKPPTTAAEAPKPFTFGQISKPQETAPAPTIATQTTPAASSHTNGNYSELFVFPSTTPAPAPQLTAQDIKKLESYKEQFLFD